MDNEQEIFNYAGQMAKLFHQLIPIDNIIAITDKEKFLCFYAEKKYNTDNFVGKPVAQKGVVYKALNSGKYESGIIDRNIYGSEFKSLAMPLKDEKGETIGALNLSVSLDSRNALMESTRLITDSSQQLASTSEEIAASTQVLSSKVSDVNKIVDEIGTYLAKTDNILKFISNIASNSQLLSINASIEAARAGELGKGFSVVAKEIQKMAIDSANSVKEAKDILQGISDDINKLCKQMGEVSTIAETHAASTEEVAASAEQLAVSSQEINRIAKMI